MKKYLAIIFAFQPINPLFAESALDYCASADSWAVQSTLATLRSQGFESEQQLQVVLLSRTLLSGQGKIAPLADYGNLYSQSLSITVRSKAVFPEVKHLLVTSIISDQECSMTQPVILDLDVLKP